MDFSKIELMPLVVLGCLAVGFVIKNTNILKDKYNQFIPLIVFILGILISWWIQGKITPENTIYGALSGLASTGLHQSFKNFIGDDKMTLNGIDISSWQSNINVGKEGVSADFVIIKATGGTGYINPDCDRAFQQAISSGKK